MRFLDRRDFLQTLAALAAGGTAAGVTGLECARAAVEQCGGRQRCNVVALPLKFPGCGATLAGYLARPRGEGRYPAKILLREDTELDASLRARVRYYAARGYVALAVDPLSRRGGSGSCSSGAGPAAARNRNSVQINDDLNAALQYLRSSPFVAPSRIETIRL